MKSISVHGLGLYVCSVLSLTSCAPEPSPRHAGSSGSSAGRSEILQVPSWSGDDLAFFLHGSMSTEVVPETVLRAFIRAYPDLFTSSDLTHFGLLPDPEFGWPVGFSRRPVPHLGGLAAVGVNCAACHVGEVAPAGGGPPVRVLGMASHFNAEAFFGSIIVATFRTASPTNLHRFLQAYLVENDPGSGQSGQELLERAWQRQEQAIAAVMGTNAVGPDGAAAGGLYELAGSDLRLSRQALAGDADLPGLSHNLLKLFHNLRTALHVPDQPPDTVPPASGPGRNDAFGLLSAVLFGAPQPYAPVKYGLVWNLDQRRWVHWDGNTQSPIGRNMLASLGLGAPLVGRHGQFDFASVQRQTTLSEGIRPPHYPFSVDRAAAQRGSGPFQARCAACHAGPEGDSRLHSPAEVGTEPQRAELFTPLQAERFNTFLAQLETPGYEPAPTPGIRSTGKYWAPSLAGVWARSPYLHNGSVRTMRELLTPPAERAKTFHRGGRTYDPEQMGYADEGSYLLDTGRPGNSNAGHDYGADLSAAEKRDLIEFLKTL